MDNARQWKMLTAVAAGGLVTVFIVAGCSGGGSGSLFSESSNSSALSSVVGTPRPTVKPTTSPIGFPTPLPTAVPNTVLTTFGISGKLSAAGMFTETAEGGYFRRFRLVPAPKPTIAPTPTTKPGPTVTPQPTVAPEPSAFYLGTYALSTGEKGNFYLVARRDTTAGGGGFPAVDVAGYKLQVVASGQALVSLHITGATGSGTVRLTRLTGALVATGTIKINSKQSFSRAANAMLDTLKIVK